MVLEVGPGDSVKWSMPLRRGGSLRAAFERTEWALRQLSVQELRPRSGHSYCPCSTFGTFRASANVPAVKVQHMAANRRNEDLEGGDERPVNRDPSPGPTRRG